MDKTIQTILTSPTLPYIVGAVAALYIANKTQSGVTSAVDNAFAWFDQKLENASVETQAVIQPVTSVLSTPFDLGQAIAQKIGLAKPDASFMGPPEPTVEQLSQQYKDPAPDNSSYVGGDENGIFPWGMP